jgi:GTP-binding protein HflX
LQEAIDADLLLHVIDAANPGYVEQIEQVQRVLKEIGADGIPQLLVFNKVDALDADHQPSRWEDEFEIEGTQTPRIFVSARESIGLPLLRQRLASIASKPQQSIPDATHIPENFGDEI